VIHEQTDFLVIGGGIIGVTVALALKRRHREQRVMLIEKEAVTGAHASGRNSGVIHAGFYYSADSLKAKFCREGNEKLRAYCRDHDVTLLECGKLVVAKDENDLAGLDELHRRGTANGVKLEMLSAAEAKRIEPRVKTHERALWSPTTASADPLQVIARLTADCEKAGVVIRRGVSFMHRDDAGIVTNQGKIAARFIINAAGLYADRIAREFGFSKKYTILPFKGLYLYSGEKTGSLRTHIYPVPDLKYPFLGVHFTVTVDGHMKIGPTAIPAFWRENYSGLDNFSLTEMGEVMFREAMLMVSAGFNFRGLAFQEMKKFSRKYLVTQAAKLLEGVEVAHYRSWGKPGIRAQLLDLETRTLVMDFCLEGDAQSLHVLNAVSPAWTCALSFAEHVVDRIGTATG
jgi:L-2-hydroxyglutarate oxidase LhgO